MNEADILLHVVDLSSPLYEKQMQVVYQILSEINAVDKTIITIFNKIDLFEEKMLALNPHFDFQSYIDHYKNSYSNNLSVLSLLQNIGIDRSVYYDGNIKVKSFR